jgi:hypothetical protein
MVLFVTLRTRISISFSPADTIEKCEIVSDVSDRRLSDEISAGGAVEFAWGRPAATAAYVPVRLGKISKIG